ncbi:MAG: type I DNA topoisomerase [Candidatus Omnitrophica bacterium]|nr:type I DNA topoisomerase [Candidatus Omnitrophota bacterium]
MPAKKKKTQTKKTSSGSRFLVIVESPAKSKTINKILGSQYKVLASMGHIIDLPTSRMGINFDNGFTPEYTVIKGRKKYLSDLKKEAKAVDIIFLAADPDREGEAICWHLKNELESGKGEIFRVSFDEITEKAVSDAFKHPRQIDMDKVNAQQARRVMDRIVGYSLSPLLWQKITRGLSAGRVQSVAVKLIVVREEEIRKFKKEEYWSIDAILRKRDASALEPGTPDSFQAKLAKYKEEKIHVVSKEQGDKIIEQLKDEQYVISDLSQKEKKSHPRSPYTTSVLQQDAFNKLNFSVNKTMRIAQTLYEGVELGGEGIVGLITYMRTDSVRISEDALKELRDFIKREYGDQYLPAEPVQYKSRKSAQAAHEAIRPSLPLKSPKEVQAFLNEDEFRLYDLIWRRFLSSQMKSAIYSVLTVTVSAGDYKFKAGGGHLLFDGFLKVYSAALETGEEIIRIPPLEKDEIVDLAKLVPEQHFTKPPARYTDASLVKMLEEKGIGRPSTYAPIISTIINRNYIKRSGKSLLPTELGELVNKLLIENFPDIVDEDFTAKLEGELDDIEEGKIVWTKVIDDFYKPFSNDLEVAKEKMKNFKKQVVETGEACEKCGKPMIVKWGKRGKFLSCSAFPVCKHSKSITSGVKCPIEGCGGELIERRSKRGAFYGCTNYPKCTYTSRKLPSTDGEVANTSEGEIEEVA